MKLSEKYNSAKVGEIDSLISSAKRFNTVIRDVSIKNRKADVISDDPAEQLRYIENKMQRLVEEVRNISFDIDALLSISNDKLKLFYEVETDLYSLKEQIEQENDVF